MSSTNGKFWAGPEPAKATPKTPKSRKPKARKSSGNEREEAKDAATGGASFFFKTPEDLKKENERAWANNKASEDRQRARKARQAEAERLKQARENVNGSEGLRKAKAWAKSQGNHDLHRQAWAKACDLFFTDKEGKAPFPQPPKSGCTKTKCVQGELLGVCHHEIDWLLNYLDKVALKRERLRWHPDKFSGLGQVHKAKAQEMFVLVQRLVDGG